MENFVFIHSSPSWIFDWTLLAMTKEQLKAFLASHGWEETKHGNFSIFVTEKTRHGLPILVKYIIRFYGKSMVEIRKENIDMPEDTQFFYKFDRIAKSNLMGIHLREDDSVSIGGVVIK